jgi:hypothetical protein
MTAQRLVADAERRDRALKLLRLRRSNIDHWRTNSADGESALWPGWRQNARIALKKARRAANSFGQKSLDGCVDVAERKLTRRFRIDAKSVPQLAGPIVQFVMWDAARGDIKRFHGLRAGSELANQIRDARRLLRSQKVGDAGGFLRIIETHRDDREAARAEPLRYFDGVRELFDARAAPGCPEVEQYDLAALSCEGSVVTTAVHNFQLDDVARGSGRIAVDPAAGVYRH